MYRPEKACNEKEKVPHETLLKVSSFETRWFGMAPFLQCERICVQVAT